MFSSGSLFDPIWVTNFWSEFNSVIASWIGMPTGPNPGGPGTVGVLVPFFLFIIALAVVARMIMMVHKISAGVDGDGGAESEGGSPTEYRDA